MVKAIIWGMGGTAQEFLRKKMLYSKYDIIAFTDSNSELMGSYFWKGVRVISPNELKNIIYDKIIICSIYYKEIIHRLINDLQIDRSSIITYKELEKKACNRLVSKYENDNDAEIQKVLKIFGQGQINVLGSYRPEVRKFHTVYYDEENFPYIMFENKRMYYPKGYTFLKRSGIEIVEDILYEQGVGSPHLYLRENEDIPDHAVIVDAGVCEGNFSLRYIDRARKIYLIENDDRWMQALQRTFRNYQDKVVFCRKMLSRCDNSREITIDKLVFEKIDFLKMDIEGGEVEALLGGRDVLERSKARCAICSYHRQYDEKYISYILESYGYKTSHSEGYMFFPYDNNMEDTLDLRRGIVYGVKE